jgi:DNA-directed RNA polymerase specialized sigma24 family protein
MSALKSTPTATVMSRIHRARRLLARLAEERP